jgi:hypothetical protein
MALIDDLLTPSDVETQLDTNWNGAVISEPTFKHAFLGDIQTNPDEILIGWADVTFTSASMEGHYELIKNSFEVVAVNSNISNIIKMLSEIRRIVTAWNISSGYVRVTNAVPSKDGSYYFFLILITQTINSQIT